MEEGNGLELRATQAVGRLVGIRNSNRSEAQGSKGAKELELEGKLGNQRSRGGEWSLFYSWPRCMGVVHLKTELN